MLVVRPVPKMKTSAAITREAADITVAIIDILLFFVCVLSDDVSTWYVS